MHSFLFWLSSSSKLKSKKVRWERAPPPSPTFDFYANVLIILWRLIQPACSHRAWHHPPPLPRRLCKYTLDIRASIQPAWFFRHTYSHNILYPEGNQSCTFILAETTSPYSPAGCWTNSGLKLGHSLTWPNIHSFMHSFICSSVHSFYC